MQRLKSVNPKVAQGRPKELLDSVQQAFGVIPNTAQVMANSPAVLDSFLAFSSAMDGVKIGEASINDVPIEEHERKFYWPAPGPRPADDGGIPSVR